MNVVNPFRICLRLLGNGAIAGTITAPMKRGLRRTPEVRHTRGAGTITAPMKRGLRHCANGR
ncbi:MAG TPA: hypothetical protein PLT85_16080, partial [Thauera aminoaromatica]|nr:hypothetical protein [Thauera aminoaromatica]